MNSLIGSAQDSAFVCFLGGFVLSVGDMLLSGELNRCNMMWNALARQNEEAVTPSWNATASFCKVELVKF